MERFVWAILYIMFRSSTWSLRKFIIFRLFQEMNILEVC